MLDRPVWSAALVFAIAFAVRLVHVWQISAGPFFDLPMGDAADFHAWALKLAQGDWLGEGVFYHAPLYPYFLGAVYAALGSDPLVIRVVQALTGALSCAFLALAGHRLFGARAGLIAGLILAFYAPAIFFDGIIQDSALDLLFATLLLWLLAEIVHRPSTLLWFLTGATLAAGVLTRQNVAVLAVPILLWLFLQRQLPARRRVEIAILFALGGAAVLAPVAVRNKVVGGELHLTTFNLGANLFIGNNPQADGYYRPLRVDRGNFRFERIDAVQIAERERGRKLLPSEVSSYWTGRALDYMVSQPIDWMRLLARKTFLVWNATEVADTEDQYTYAEWSWPLRLSGYAFHLGVIGPLALLGVWVTWPERRRLWLFYVMPAVYLGSVALFFVFARYRYPAVPGLVLLAAAGLAWLPAFLKDASRGRRVALLAAFVAAAIVANWPTIPTRRLRAGTHANIGAALDNVGEQEQALQYLERSVRLDPESAKARYFLGTAYQKRTRPDEAIQQLQEALRLAPDNPQVYNNYGVTLASLRRLEEAAVHFQTAIALDPLFAEAYVNLGNVHRLRGDLDQAIDLFLRGVEADPELPGARIRLANALILAGQTERAFLHYEVASRQQAIGPAMAPVLQYAWSLATNPDPAERDGQRASEIVRRLSTLVEANALVLRTQAAAYAAAARFEEAVAAAERALATLATEGDAGGAERRGEEQLAVQIRRELELYRIGLPYINPGDR